MNQIDHSPIREGVRRVAPVQYPVRWVRSVVSGVSFRTGIILPVLYLPFVFRGIESPDGLVVFLGLIGLHLLALIGGHQHRTESE